MKLCMRLSSEALHCVAARHFSKYPGHCSVPVVAGSKNTVAKSGARDDTGYNFSGDFQSQVDTSILNNDEINM